MRQNQDDGHGGNPQAQREQDRGLREVLLPDGFLPRPAGTVEVEEPGERTVGRFPVAVALSVDGLRGPDLAEREGASDRLGQGRGKHRDRKFLP